MWLYLIDLVKTSQRNDWSGTIHSTGYEFCRELLLFSPYRKVLFNSVQYKPVNFQQTKIICSVSKSWYFACPWRLCFNYCRVPMFWFTMMLSPTNSLFFPVRSARRHSQNIGLLDLQLYFEGLRSDKLSHKYDSNKYQSKAFLICDHRSDKTRSATHVNKTYLVWLMYWLLFNQHYQHRTNEKLRSWANAAFICGVCSAQAFPSLLSPSPVILVFALFPAFSTNSRGNACYAGYSS